jgi:hypothetical protein
MQSIVAPLRRPSEYGAGYAPDRETELRIREELDKKLQAEKEKEKRRKRRGAASALQEKDSTDSDADEQDDTPPSSLDIYEEDSVPDESVVETAKEQQEDGVRWL